MLLLHNNMDALNILLRKLRRIVPFSFFQNIDRQMESIHDYEHNYVKIVTIYAFVVEKKNCLIHTISTEI